MESWGKKCVLKQNWAHGWCYLCLSGMNAAVRATVRVGIYTGAKVYFVHEVLPSHTNTHTGMMLLINSVWGPSQSNNTFFFKTKHSRDSVSPHLQLVFMCAPGLPGPGGWRRPHPPRHLGECVHDAAAGEWRVEHRNAQHKVSAGPQTVFLV